MKIRSILTRLTLAVSSMAVAILCFGSGSAMAATNGRMIDDSVFDASGSMSAADIQSFLNGFPNSCLKSYSDDMPVADPLNAYFSYSGTGTSAQIIRRVADNWGINPRVLLAKLEQESSLVSGSGGCAEWRYWSAIGFNCPGPVGQLSWNGRTITTCVQNAANVGLSRQLSKGGWLLKWGKERANGNLNWLVYDDGAYNYGGPMTQGNRQRSRSGGVVYFDGYWNGVYLESGATASLYNYTPFLNQGFDEIWESWWGVGSTYGVAYRAAYTAQSTYPTILAGQQSTAYFEYKNTGNSPWYDDTSAAAHSTNPVHLATSSPINRRSLFGSSWAGGPNRPGLVFTIVYRADGSAYQTNPHVVQPGELVGFQFALSAPLTAGSGTYRENFQPIVEGTADGSFPSVGTYLDVAVTTPRYALAFYRQANYMELMPGQTSTAYIDYKNNSNVSIYDDVSAAANSALPVHLATASPINRASALGSTWGGGRNRPSLSFAAVYEADGTTLAASQHIATPGQIIRTSFTFSVPAGQKPGLYREYFQPIVEGTADGAIPDPGTYLEVGVVAPRYTAGFVRQSDFLTLTSGQSSAGYFDLRNTGNMPWYDDTSLSAAPAGSMPVHLSTSLPTNRASVFGATWTSSRNRPSLNFAAVYEANGTTLATNQHVVQVGQIGRFGFTFTVPSGQAAGLYREYFRPLVEGSPDGLIPDLYTYLEITVR